MFWSFLIPKTRGILVACTFLLSIVSCTSISGNLEFLGNFVEGCCLLSGGESKNRADFVPLSLCMLVLEASESTGKQVKHF